MICPIPLRDFAFSGFQKLKNLLASQGRRLKAGVAKDLGQNRTPLPEAHDTSACPQVRGPSRNAVRDPWPARRARMLYVLRRQEHVSVRMCASGVGEVASSPYTFVVGPGARWRPRCTRVDGGCLRRPTPRRLVFAWRSEARRLLDERERAIEPRLSFCCCRILFCWCWAFTRGGS